MADQFRWFKLWTSALDDPDLANLSMEDFGRWCVFGAYLKQHGTDGSIVLRPPAVSVCQRLRVADMNAALACISSWPNVQIRRDADSDDPVTQAATVTWRNWRKYQRDSSATRMRAKRARDRISVTPKRRGDETRGEETKEKQARASADTCQQKSAEVSRSRKASRVVLSDDQFLKFWSAYPKKVGKDEAARAWAKRGCEAVAGEILPALERQREYLLREDGKYIPNPATWLNQGRWKDDPPRPAPATSDPYAKFPRSAP